MKIPESDYERIAQLIHSDASPVGIDAKRTHVMIVHMLERLEQRLARLEEQLGSRKTD